MFTFFRMYFFRQPFLIVGDPDMIKEILVKEFPKFHDRMVRMYKQLIFHVIILINLMVVIFLDIIIPHLIESIDD